jgi:2-dehydro-3-deoxyphosphogluconate aldolase/(4S)-4-hydroxy-2-oxoglutarate aldolase
MTAAPVLSPLDRLKDCGIVPVVTIDDVGKAVELAHALAAGGVDVIEVTLRTKSGMASLKQIAERCPQVLPVAGTVVLPDQARAVADAGASIVVSPGFTEAVDAAMAETGLPWLPGVSTASDCMRAVAAGRLNCKFFPAEQAGGPGGIKALSGPFPLMKFCPTGGVSLANLASYLSLKQVLCVGGSWLVPAEALAAGDFKTIEAKAREARAAVDAIRMA